MYWLKEDRVISMYAQAVRTSPPLRRGRRKQSSAYEQCAKGCAFSDVQLDCIKYLKLGDPCCGSGGFFLATQEYLTDPANYPGLTREEKQFIKTGTFYGTELVPVTYKLCHNQATGNRGTAEP